MSNRRNETLLMIPTYNERENVEKITSDILALKLAADLVFLDDNSPDGTGEVADRLSKELPGVHVLHRPGKQGLGTAYIAGFRWALERDYRYVLEMDADFSHHPRYLPDFMEQIRHADLVIGSRYVQGGGTANWGLLRRLISAVGNTFARTTLRLRTHDCTGGFRCYRRELLTKIPWESLRLQGYGFQVGAVYCVERMGASVAEFPIVFEDRRKGRSKMSSRIVMEAFLFVIRTVLLGQPSRRGPGP